MINAHLKNRDSAPAWAILGAPLVGIPLLVGLLALAQPRTEVDDSPNRGMATIEQVEEPGVGAPDPCPEPSTGLPVRNG